MLQVPRANGIFTLPNKRDIAQTCAICGQRMVSQFMIKNHYLNSDKELRQALGSGASKFCASSVALVHLAHIVVSPVLPQETSCYMSGAVAVLCVALAGH